MYISCIVITNDDTNFTKIYIINFNENLLSLDKVAYVTKALLREYNAWVCFKMVYMINVDVQKLPTSCKEVYRKNFHNFFKFHKPDKIQLPVGVQLYGLLYITSQLSLRHAKHELRM